MKITGHLYCLKQQNIHSVTSVKDFASDIPDDCKRQQYFTMSPGISEVNSPTKVKLFKFMLVELITYRWWEHFETLLTVRKSYGRRLYGIFFLNFLYEIDNSLDLSSYNNELQIAMAQIKNNKSLVMDMDYVNTVGTCFSSKYLNL